MREDMEQTVLPRVVQDHDKEEEDVEARRRNTSTAEDSRNSIMVTMMAMAMMMATPREGDMAQSMEIHIRTPTILEGTHHHSTNKTTMGRPQVEEDVLLPTPAVMAEAEAE